MNFGILPPDVHEVEVDVLMETEKAFLFRQVCSDAEGWFPKSEITYDQKETKPNELMIVVAIPEWLLEKNDYEF